MHPDYYEGILQLRNPTSEVANFVKRFSPSISKTKTVKNGSDYYFVSQRLLRSVGKDLQKRFSGELKTSRKLHTRSRQTGKPVYRVTVLFRCYQVHKGDLVQMKGETFLVLAVGKKVYLQNQKSGTKQWVAYDKLPRHLREA